MDRFYGRPVVGWRGILRANHLQLRPFVRPLDSSVSETMIIRRAVLVDPVLAYGAVFVVAVILSLRIWRRGEREAAGMVLAFGAHCAFQAMLFHVGAIAFEIIR